MSDVRNDSENGAALKALEAFVKASDQLSKLWGDLDETSWLEANYPKNLPSFDEFSEDLQAWLNHARRNLSSKG